MRIQEVMVRKDETTKSVNSYGCVLEILTNQEYAGPGEAAESFEESLQFEPNSDDLVRYEEALKICVTPHESRYSRRASRLAMLQTTSITSCSYVTISKRPQDADTGARGSAVAGADAIEEI